MQDSHKCIDGKLDDCLLDMLVSAILDAWLLLADFLRDELSTMIVELFKPVEAIAGMPHYLAGL